MNTAETLSERLCKPVYTDSQIPYCAEMWLQKQKFTIHLLYKDLN